MTTSYPGSLDVLMTLAEGMDRPAAAYWNRLLAGLQKPEETLGTDPSDPNRGSGSAWNSGSKYNDVAELLDKIAAIEVGTFDIDGPTNSPVIVNFVNAGRFNEPDDLFIKTFPVNASKGYAVGRYSQTRLQILGTTGNVNGFEFYRRGLDGENPVSGNNIDLSPATWLYLAIEDKL